MFLVTPLSGALLVWVTFAIGRRLGIGRARARGGMAHRDEPCGAGDARVADERRAGCGVLGAGDLFRARHVQTLGARWPGSPRRRAILIRPNLAPLAAVAGCLEIVGRAEGRCAKGTEAIEWHSASALPSRLVAGTIPGCLFIAWINNASTDRRSRRVTDRSRRCFRSAHIPTNLARYGSWLVESQTPLAVVGIAAAVRAA